MKSVKAEIVANNIWSVRIEPPLTSGETKVLETWATKVGATILSNTSNDKATLCHIEASSDKLDIVLSQAFDPFGDDLLYRQS